MPEDPVIRTDILGLPRINYNELGRRLFPVAPMPGPAYVTHSCHEAVEGQTIVRHLTRHTGRFRIYRNGVLQNEGHDYESADSSAIEFVSPLHSGEFVDIQVETPNPVALQSATTALEEEFFNRTESRGAEGEKVQGR